MNLVISVFNKERQQLVDEICTSLSLPVVLTAHGSGTAVESMRELLGIDKVEKHVVLTVASTEKTKELIKKEKQLLHIGVPGHGITVAVPLKSVGGGTTLAYLNNNEEITKKQPELNCAYELIVAIANEGCTDTVMNAARAAGAKGGTVIHAKGTFNEQLQRFRNISIADEKEVILIVSPTAIKAEIMRSVLEKAGPETQAATILFSLPTTEVAGFGLLDE